MLDLRGYFNGIFQGLLSNYRPIFKVEFISASPFFIFYLLNDIVDTSNNEG